MAYFFSCLLSEAKKSKDDQQTRKDRLVLDYQGNFREFDLGKKNRKVFKSGETQEMDSVWSLEVISPTSNGMEY